MSKLLQLGSKFEKWLLIGIIVIFIFLSNQIVSANLQTLKNKFTFVKKAEFIPLFIIIAIIGGCITVTLSYISWLKYKAEKEKRKKRSK